MADKPEVTILFTQLTDTPPRYSLQVNNPTDQPLTVTLKKAMDLPGFDFPERKLELAPGQLLDVLPETTATR